jgi:hypothetical protein
MLLKKIYTGNNLQVAGCGVLRLRINSGLNEGQHVASKLAFLCRTDHQPLADLLQSQFYMLRFAVILFAAHQSG